MKTKIMFNLYLDMMGVEKVKKECKNPVMMKPKIVEDQTPKDPIVQKPPVRYILRKHNR
jgi:hypothetical protein